jgi:O-antigen ligase
MTKKPLFGKTTSRWILAFLSIFLIGWTAALSDTLLQSLILGLGCLSAAWLLLRKPAWILILIIAFSPFVSYVRDFTIWETAGTTVTLSGVFWFGIAFLCVLLLLRSVNWIHIPAFLFPFILLTSWTAIRFIVTPIGLTGVKDVFFYGLPAVLAIFTLVLLQRKGNALLNFISKSFLLSVFIPLFLYAVFIPSGDIRLTELGPEGFLDARATAYYLLLVLPVGLSVWKYGEDSSEKQLGAVVSLIAFGLILFTLSRMASFLAVFFLVLFVLKPPRFGRLFLGGMLATLLLSAVLLFFPFLQQSASANADGTALVNLLSLRSSGRSLFWPVTFNHALEQPFFGWGPGSARILVAQSITNRNLTEYYPHNEYLQVFHDLGLLGLGILLLAWIPLAYQSWKAWIVEHYRANACSARWAMAAFLAVLAILMTAITTNTFHYPFVMGPAFILLAASHGSRRLTENSRIPATKASVDNTAADNP